MIVTRNRSVMTNKPRVRAPRMSSPVHRIPLAQLRRQVAKAGTFRSILRHFGLPGQGGSIHTLRRRLIHHEIPHKHLRTGYAHAKGFPGYLRVTAAVLLPRLLVGANLSGSTVRKYLIRTGVLANLCAICSLLPRWNGKPLTLQLDHKNGKRSDWRLSNLRLLCPNCHSQTPTYGGANKTHQRMVAKAGVEPA